MALHGRDAGIAAAALAPLTRVSGRLGRGRSRFAAAAFIYVDPAAGALPVAVYPDQAGRVPAVEAPRRPGMQRRHASASAMAAASAAER